MRKNGINLSPKHGVNPTIPVCFWCGQEKNEIVLLGRIGGKEDLEAPQKAVLDFKPCNNCKAGMGKGITLIEVTNEPNKCSEIPIQDGLYPTSRWAVIKQEAAERLFKDIDFNATRKLFVDAAVFDDLFGKGQSDNAK